jgi:hypothetical protein
MSCPFAELKEPRPAAFLEAMPMTPYDWFTAPDGSVRANEIWRMEDMRDFTDKFDLPPLWYNRQPKNLRYNVLWTPDDLALIKKRFHRELEHYK